MKIRVMATFVVVASASLVLAACGSSSSTSETTTAAPAETSSTTAAPSSSGAHASTSTTAAGGEVRHVNELTAFMSPTGNLGCYISPDSARCDIRERNWTPPAKPADCKYDYGHGVEVTRTAPAAFVCAGDSAIDPSSHQLAYGHAIQAGVLRCTSTESGMECTSTESGHGFKISRESYHLS